MTRQRLILVLFFFSFSCKEETEQKPSEKKLDTSEQKDIFSEEEAEDLAKILKVPSIEEINSEIVEEITIGKGYTSRRTVKNGHVIYEYKLTFGILSCNLEVKTSDEQLMMDRTNVSDSLKLILKSEPCFSKIQIKHKTDQRKLIRPIILKTDKSTIHIFEIDFTILPDNEYEIELLQEKKKKSIVIPVTITTRK